MRILAMIAAGAVSAASVPAMGALLDDIVQPPWERFQPFTTFQEWEFLNDGDIGPDGQLPPFNPNTHFPLVAKPGPGVFWDPSFPGTNLQGVYIGGATESYIDFCVPNWIDQEPLKIVWIQFNGIWQPGFEPFVGGIVGGKGPDPVDGVFAGSDETFPGLHRVEVWEMRPNPDFENIRVFLPEGAVLNQVVIDTISFPTPGVVSAFGLAGIGLARRRR